MIELEDHSVIHHMPPPPQNQHVAKDFKKKEPREADGHYSVSTNAGSDSKHQLSLFPEEPKYIEDLRKLDIEKMTPLDALNYLETLIGRVREDGP